MVIHCPWRVIVWDLDDTLILERDFVRSGFRAVAAHVAGRCAVDAGAVSDFLWSGFESGVRGNAFDRVHEHFPETRSIPVAAIVEAYRTHCPDIQITDEALSILRRLRQAGAAQAAITDGPLAGQRSKADAVGLNDLIDLVVFTDEWGREFWKPHDRAFLTVQERFGAAPGDCVYIGDNPSKDFVSPRALGWGSIRLRRDGQLHAALEDGTPAELTARGWNELAELLGVGEETI